MGYDIAIVGGGPGGYVAAIRAAQLGKRVALVEKDRVGGLCLNWGCIPSKALLWNAEVVRLVRDGGTYGVSFDNLRVDMGAAIDRSRQVADTMVKGVEFLLDKHKVTRVHGHATFTSPRELRTDDGTVVEAEHVIIATGRIRGQFLAWKRTARRSSTAVRRWRSGSSRRAWSSSVAARSAANSQRFGGPTAWT